jgi:hypothetical protein
MSVVMRAARDAMRAAILIERPGAVQEQGNPVWPIAGWHA